MLEELEVVFKERWKLEYGSDAKLFLSCEGAPDEQHIGWQKRDHFPVLGHIVSLENSTSECWRVTRKAMWSSFWKNAGALDTATNTAKKLALLRRWTLPRLEFVMPRWAFTKDRANDLDKLQLKMISKLVRITRDRAEDRKSYFGRRDQVCETLAEQSGRWSVLWADRLLRWSDHLRRERNAGSWASKLLRTEDAAWLRLQRLPFVCAARSLLAGATATRVLAERPKARWEEALDAALAHAQT